MCIKKITECKTEVILLGPCTVMNLIMLIDIAVDPRGELVDPGVNSRQVGSATARPPADDPNEEPTTSAWCLTGQRTP